MRKVRPHTGEAAHALLKALDIMCDDFMGGVIIYLHNSPPHACDLDRWEKAGKPFSVDLLNGPDVGFTYWVRGVLGNSDAFIRSGVLAGVEGFKSAFLEEMKKEMERDHREEDEIEQ